MTLSDTYSLQPTAPKVTLRDEADVLELVPYLLGFAPRESLVLLVVVDGRVAVTTRVDIDACFSDDITDFVETLAQRFPGFAAVVVVYSDDPDRARRAAAITELALGRDRVLSSVCADDARYWRRDGGVACDGGAFDDDAFEDGAFDDQAHYATYGSGGSSIPAEAVGAGLAVIGTREDLARLVAPPCGDAARIARRSAKRVKAGLVATNMADARERFYELEDQGLAAVRDRAEMSDDEWIELGLLIHDVRLRDLSWMSIERDEARDCSAMWQQVARSLPEPLTAPALAVAGMAAWISGNGAMLVICLEQGRKVDASVTLFNLLSDLNTNVIDPACWDDLRAAWQADVDAMTQALGPDSVIAL